ncbi:hypothetical protein JAAARDRAFT_284233 [Jaapia argillacea MUCL 33604]|uniref:F-box domain-containing protein n=1 Tax=Jaapia argillacea MUCL 33604 TaxID=933084 RepID=A0A067PTD2_9AGAM|nr:hypothetical protein JAAARDRAFT_284233 [Jaapia argillacea MUCL 33604]
MLLQIPYDVQLQVLSWLSVADILSVGKTCRPLNSLTQNRAVWHQVLERMLAMIPVPKLARSCPSMSVPGLRECAIRAARLDAKWQRENLAPVTVYSVPCPPNVYFARLLAGGDWVALVSSSASVYLQEITDGGVAAVRQGRSIEFQRLGCDLSLSASAETMLLVTGQNPETEMNHIFLYQLNTDVPSIQLWEDVSFSDRFLSAAAAFDLLAFACPGEEEEELITIRRVGPDMRDRRQQVIMEVEDFPGIEDSTITLLSNNRLLISNGFGFALFPIPDLETVEVDDTTEEIISVHPLWSLQRDLTVFPPLVSPVVWEARDKGHVRPVMVLDYHALHILDIASFPPNHRVIPLPVRDDGDLTTVGFRRGVWWNSLDPSPEGREPMMRLRTCTFPQLRRNIDLARVSSGDFNVTTGSVIFPTHHDETAESLSFDEWTGRVCIILKGGPDGRRAIVINVVA